jgi:hypothetical protein
MVLTVLQIRHPSYISIMRLFLVLVALVGVTADHLRVAQNKYGRRHLKVKSADGSIEVSDDKKGDKLQAKLDKDSYVLTFKVGKNNFQIRSSPKLQEIEIRKIGSKKNDMTADDREFLSAVAEALETDDSMDTDAVDAAASQSARLARVLAEWPDTLDIDFTFDKEREMERANQRLKDARDHSVPAGAPAVPSDGDRRLLHNPPSQEVLVDENGHRRLSYTTLCSQLYTYVQATHDDFWYDRWNDKTTYNAYVAPYAACPAADGTYFWKNSQWQCYEPDHDANVEYAYGDCFGRCGAGCGGNGQGTYTHDCLDHDSCVRFGHSLASFWCNDEFVSTLDDAAFAPNCI